MTLASAQSGTEAAEATKTTEALGPVLEYPVQLTIDDIPAQPLSHEGQLRVEFVPQSADPASFKPSTGIVSYRLASGYGAVQFNGELGSASLTAERTYTSPDEYLREVTTRLPDLERSIAGRIRTPSDTWEDMAAGVPHDVDFEVFGGVRLGGCLGFDRPVFGPREDLFDWFYPPKQLDWRFVPTDLTGFRKICTVFETDFRDGRRGETYPAGTVPAAYMRATLLSNKILRIDVNGNLIRESIWSGYLDADGCTENINLTEASYTLVVKSELQRTLNPGWILFDVEEKKGSRPRQDVSWALSFRTTVIALAGSRPNLELSIPPGLAANAAAVAAQVQRTQEEALASATYNVLISDNPADCDNRGAYADPERGVYLCPNSDDIAGEHNAYYKFTVAHEVGHHAEQKGGGTIPSPPREDVYTFMDQALPELCTCAHVVPQDSALHCLQSLEVYAIGSKEGFGQFFATRVWNDPAATAPRFQYYKEFKEPNKAVIPAGSKVINVRQTPIRWADANCSSKVTGRSTEYDFLGFYWAINTAPANERTSMPELYNIMNHVNKNPADATHNGSWAVYREAASTVFGQGSEKFAKFDVEGPRFGVNH